VKTLSAVATDSDSGSTELFIAVLVFGLLVLAVIATVQALKDRGLTENFVKLYGLLFVGTVATAVIFAGVNSEVRTGAYTILGTIAGYLAGGKIKTAQADLLDKDGKVPQPAEEDDDDEEKGGA
jgi:hypothetical protein